ncbi:hypothetical protein FBU30_002988 [Linnemannia zychae]|nr:hypothetical protein FBU30_002988 [Linnemannia zychae]
MSLLCTTFVILSGIGVASTQALQPVPVHSMAYATIGESTLYISGGATDPENTKLTNQFYSLDLTKPTWDTFNPPWKVLNIGTATLHLPPVSNHTMTTGDDGQSLIVCYSYSPYNSGIISSAISKYSVNSSSWHNEVYLKPKEGYTVSASVIRSVITNPNTNLVYIPGAYLMETNMVVFNSSAINSTAETNIKSFSIAAMPSIPTLERVLSGYSAIWSDYRNSILLFGGRYEATSTDFSSQPGTFVDVIFEYNATVGSWSTVGTEGPMPVNITRHCTVQAKNGTKLVVFGGSSSPNADIVPLGDIHILDVPTMTWSRGKSADSSQFRAAMACSVVGDNFIAWGGTTGTEVLNSTIIYDLKNGQWTNKYVRSYGANNSRNTGVIIGCIIVSVFVLGLTIGYFVYTRRKQSQTSRRNAPQDKDMNEYNADHSAIKRDPHESTSYSTNTLRSPSLLPADLKLQFEILPEKRNPEYTPQLHYQDLSRTDPQYSSILHQEHQQQLLQRQQKYWDNLEELRQELELFKSSSFPQNSTT